MSSGMMEVVIQTSPQLLHLVGKCCNKQTAVRVWEEMPTEGIYSASQALRCEVRRRTQRAIRARYNCSCSVAW
jgi:hypothetical protein